jgi:D-beta-D-heptose 7-phosphate kinase/D-beta-D-heptose 1-phosphate adenosyltransferase
LVDPPLHEDYSKFTGATLITPNRKETTIASGIEVDTIENARQAAEKLYRQLQLEAAVITLDKEGAYLHTAKISEQIPTKARTVYDVTGAGDMMLATIAVALAAGYDYKTATQLSNIAAGLEVEKFGVATVNIDEIVNEILAERKGKAGKIRDSAAMPDEMTYRRKAGQKIVFTNGCFDVLHVGHIEYLKFCKSHGDIVVVGLNSDNSVRQLKGPTRPINNQHERAAVLAALEYVDYVVIFDRPDPLELVEQVKPDILIKGVDWAEKGVIGREFVESYGGKVILAPMVDGKSTTATLEKMKRQ